MKLNFFGTIRSIFFIQIKNFFKILLSFGFYIPWAITNERKYFCNNIELEGHRFIYNGTGRELFKSYAKITILYFIHIIILSVIKSFYPIINDPNIENTISVLKFFLLIGLYPVLIFASLRYKLSRTTWQGVRLGLNAKINEFLKTYYLTTILSFITFNIYSPIKKDKIYSKIVNNLWYGNQKFEYRGNVREIFPVFINCYFLSFFTLGLSLFWYEAKMLNYRAKNTYFGSIRFELNVTPGELIKLSLGNLLLIIFTLGIGSSWAKIRTLRFYAQRLTILGSLDEQVIDQQPKTKEYFYDALAELNGLEIEI